MAGTTQAQAAGRRAADKRMSKIVDEAGTTQAQQAARKAADKQTTTIVPRRRW